MPSPTLSKAFILVSVLISGLCFYLGFSLNGNLGWLMWIAPIPVLFISLQVKPGQTFLVAFIAYLIGKLSWLSYLLNVLPKPLAFVYTLLIPLIFALVVLASRKIHKVAQNNFSVLAFPILFTAYEYLLFIFSPDGTATSIAYTQSNYLPVIQIASLTGILGISFLLCLVPSVIALVCYNLKQKKNNSVLLSILSIVLVAVFVYGLMRLREPQKGKTLELGLAVIDESAYKGVYQHDRAKEMELTTLYLQEVNALADRGAKIVLLPEKTIVANDSTCDAILQKFASLAAERRIQIIFGGTKQKTGFYLNNAWVISNRGVFLADYQKVNLFEGEVLDGCKPGIKISIYRLDTLNEGVAICKDMDFQQFILGYSKKSPAVLYVPAWDFVQDGWLHSRMAILRSVEGGFSLVRNARQGRLTLSDWRGMVVAEANCESGTPAELLGELTVEAHTTIYARAGDWFGTVCLFAAAGFFFFVFSRRNKKTA
ncbi:MAG TPA: nitrilase-related carbon-nitrogen hydrolase [Puia sp.]